jgi:hypothetical protein
MSLVLSGQAINAEKQDLSKDAKSNLTKLAAWINERNIPFLTTPDPSIAGRILQSGRREELE